MKQSTITTLIFVLTMASILSSCGSEELLFEIQPDQTQVSNEGTEIS